MTKNFTTQSLAEKIASTEFEGDVIIFNKTQYSFSDTEVLVTGTVHGYFDVQKQTYDDPPFCDLNNVDVDIQSVEIYTEDSVKILSVNEIEKLEQEVKKVWH